MNTSTAFAFGLATGALIQGLWLTWILDREIKKMEKYLTKLTITKCMKKLISKICNAFWPVEIKEWHNLMAQQSDIVISIPDWKKVVMTKGDAIQLSYYFNEIKKLLN